MRNVRAGTRLLASIVLPVLAAQAVAQSKDLPSPADLSRSAIEGHLRTADSAWMASASSMSSGKFARAPPLRRRRTPWLRWSFKRGLSEDALLAFIAAQQLELARIELKVAVSQDPPVFTISIGGMDLLRVPAISAIGCAAQSIASVRSSRPWRTLLRARSRAAFVKSLSSYRSTRTPLRPSLRGRVSQPCLSIRTSRPCSWMKATPG